MPHCLVEYSNNVVDTVDAHRLFHDLHTALMEFEAFAMHDIKSRLVRRDTFFIGDGNPRNAFVALKFSLLSGRDISVRQRITQVCLKVLQTHFADSIATLDCQVSVELREMERSTYAKHGATS